MLFRSVQQQLLPDLNQADHLVHVQVQVVHHQVAQVQADQPVIDQELIDHHQVARAATMIAGHQIEVQKIVQNVIAMTDQSRQLAISVVNGPVNDQKQVMIASDLIDAMIVRAVVDRLVLGANLNNEIAEISETEMNVQQDIFLKNG